MDVRCERCNTEYEFDDALVSGRGTTVKCTSCGHKFKIRRRDGDFSEDFWNVQTGDGRTLVFTSLRELQRAIQTSLVVRTDMLSRGGLPPKPIGQIPELAPFFDKDAARKSAAPPAAAPAPAPATTAAAPESIATSASSVGKTTMIAGSSAGTTPGVNPPAPVSRETASFENATQTRSSRPPPPPGINVPALEAPPRQRMSTRPDFPPSSDMEPSPPPPPSMKKTLVGTGPDEEVRALVAEVDARMAAAAVAAAAPPAAPAAPAAPPAPEPSASIPLAEPMRARAPSLRPSEPPPTEREAEPDTQRYESAPRMDRTQPIPDLEHVIAIPRRTPPPPAFEASSPLPAPTAHAVRSSHGVADADEYSDHVRGSLSDAPSGMGRRRSVGGYVIALVVLAGAAGVALWWARDHMPGLLAPPKTTTTTATADPRVTGLLSTGEKALADGNLDAAKESFDKASALAEKDPHVLLDVARLAATRADVPWLRTRLLASEATDDQRITRESLNELSATAKKAADDVLAVSPDDPAAIRTKVDALRIAGERDAARALVAKLGAVTTQQETAYVLAALDLAENEPLWSTVIERLRTAASAESGPGRGRAALAYALARSGDGPGAKSEVDRLSSMARPHPLLPLLRAYADHAKPSVKLDAGAPDGAAAAAVLDKHGRPIPGTGGGLSSDPRVLVVQAEKARARGDYDKAQQLYAAAVDRNPNDAEALSGLAAIAYSRRDLNGARQSYKRVLSINPSYVPALVGVGDVDWDSGDRSSAMKMYKEIVERFPEGTYPARVKQRLDSGSGGASSGSAPPPAPPTPTATPAPSDTGGGG